MVKAHSLLYAIYICLIVSIICGALLYISNLYNQLNSFYNVQEELYIQNQSTVNFALGNKTFIEEIPRQEDSGINSNYRISKFGLLNVLIAKSSKGNDTVVSAHLIGSSTKDKTAIYLSNISRSLFYSGQLKIVGNIYLPSTYIETRYINNKPNQLSLDGKSSISEIQLPEINPEFKKVFDGIQAEKTALSDVDKPRDSLFFNSFLNKPKEIYVNSVIGNVIFKGNFILRSKDSIRIQKNTVLEDVIVIAPKITFEEGFTGTVQAFATKGVALEQNVILNYPSVVCVYNSGTNESKIKIKKESTIIGAVVLFGNTKEMIDKNNIEIEENGLIYGDIYCTGKLLLKSKVYGSIYTNAFRLKTESSLYENTISDIEINTTKHPNYFISIPLFEAKKTTYGIIKKVL